ncbi:MAG: LysR family transcriptional regulator [Rhodospirillales bacterium]|nr:LysR family transcriptional regulator [Rhodospirillales bacterium]
MPSVPSRRRLPPLNWLRAFESAARHMSFTEAAEELGVTQAAVSQQVRQLEDWLGTQLFKRLPRALALTDTGIAYLPSVRDSFDRLDIGTEQIFGRLDRRPVTLRATATLAALWLAPRLAEFRREQPEITVRTTTLYAPVDFGQDGVDIEIRYGSGNWPGVRSHKLFDESYFPVASPAYLAAAPRLASPVDIPHHRLIHVLGEREGWGNYFQRFGIAGLPLAEGLQCDSMIVALHGCVAGGGVMLATAPLVDRMLATGVLADTFGERIPARFCHHLVIPETGEPPPEVAAVFSWLLARQQNPGAGWNAA